MGEVDRLFAQSPAVQRVYEGIGVDSERFTVVGNFYDPTFGTHDPELRPFAAERSILYVGNLRPHKGVELLVDCADSMPDDVSIEIVGTGPVREQLERRAVEQGVESIVTFHGWVDHAELPAYYRDADVFVHPGLWPEPFNRTLLEAMQHDCALVVSDIGGPPWVIGDCGATFARGDLDGLRDILGSLLADQDRLAALQQKCAERVMRFTPDRVVSKIESEYRSLG
jgi:glycosyltransferase involved in cell wall biosynthesis